MKHIAVFCGSKVGSGPMYGDAARELGEEMARRGYGLVYGGGRIGLMGEVANAALRCGGYVLGVIPRGLAEREIAHTGASELVLVNTMHERKALMADRSQAFVALPGGFGTCDELFEVLTWAQLGIHDKPIVLLNVCSFFNPLLNWIGHMVAEGFLNPRYRQMIRVAETTSSVFDLIEEHEAAGGCHAPWRDKDER